MLIDATSMIFAPSLLHREGRASARRMAEVNEGRFQHSLDKPPQCRMKVDTRDRHNTPGRRRGAACASGESDS